jgi:thiol-disulfide isomerase/thioredoxin
MKRWTAFTAAFAVAACAGLAVAQESGDKPAQKTTAKAESTAKLNVGDPAPALSVEKWVKGDAITGFEKGRVYVVEFWATWCGPCIRSMPHLSEIQKEFKDKGLTVVGVTSEDTRGNTLESVEKMVSNKADKMGYTVAWDKGRDTNKAYMEAAGQAGIPCSFVVDQKGNIAYVGHPMTLDYVLGKVVDNKWDYKTGPEAAQAEYKKVADEKRAVTRKIEEDPKAALALMNEFDAKHPKLAFSPEEKFRLQVEAGDAGANETGKKLVDSLVADKDAQRLNEFAWTLVDPEGDVKNPPLDAALKAAQEAARLTEEKDGAILDTLARVYWLKGEKGKAIEIQRKAVEHATEQFKDELVQRLKEYEADGKN